MLCRDLLYLAIATSITICSSIVNFWQTLALSGCKKWISICCIDDRDFPPATTFAPIILLLSMYYPLINYFLIGQYIDTDSKTKFSDRGQVPVAVHWCVVSGRSNPSRSGPKLKVHSAPFEIKYFWTDERGKWKHCLQRHFNPYVKKVFLLFFYYQNHSSILSLKKDIIFSSPQWQYKYEFDFRPKKKDCWFPLTLPGQFYPARSINFIGIFS